MAKRLVLKDGPVAGVCSGLADYFGIDPVIPRLIFLAMFFTAGGGLLLYFIFWLAMPKGE